MVDDELTLLNLTAEQLLSQNDVHLMLSDVIMPKMNGFELAQIECDTHQQCYLIA